MSEITPEVTDMIQQLSDEFDRFCVKRHEAGMLKYGPFKFIGADVIQEILEEMGDISNYVRYEYIKLRMLAIHLAEDPRVAALTNEDGEAVIGIDSFRSS